jgi:predicted GNAT family acetyltransferase
MAIDRPPQVRPDPRVRTAGPDDEAALLPAMVAMFTEEVGVSPLAAGGGPAYRARLADLIGRGHSLLIRDGEAVAFKAELAEVSPWACQIQGVWVAPDRRGGGVGTAGMAAVVEYALSLAPTVSLYVNAHNSAARRCYQRVGFVDVGRFATLLW